MASSTVLPIVAVLSLEPVGFFGMGGERSGFAGRWQVWERGQVGKWLCFPKKQRSGLPRGGGTGNKWGSMKSKNGSNKGTQQKKKAYAAAGVDVDLGNRVKSGIQALVKGTHGPEVLGKIGGFGGLFRPNFKGM